ncbi:hypothetical protein [Comamonas thiooxydans]|uniref:hypothetical protein n=1 Tax=Comamonas thiooxydans TaxID=363952 RepID=UPI000B40D669|nr:hypothetical protein [Comamonas thiooxydans]
MTAHEGYMSNLSVRRASEAAIGIAALRQLASTPENSYAIDSMADEMLGEDSRALSVRTGIHTLAARESGFLKERATHATVSPRVNETRERELASMVSVYAAALTTLNAIPALRSNDADGINVLQESFVTAMQGIDQFPMGAKARQELRAQFQSETALAVPEANRPQVAELLLQAEQIYLKRCADMVYSHYDEPNDGPSPSM